jgi:hypothetical protein
LIYKVIFIENNTMFDKMKYYVLYVWHVHRIFIMSRRLTQEIDLDSGVILEEVHRVDQKLHRLPSEGPALVNRHVSGGTVTVTLEEYRVHGKLHREEGPARIRRDDETGIVTLEEYRVNGRLHRDQVDGPALLIRHPATDVVVREEYVHNGKFHRDPTEGAAVVQRDSRTGAVWREEYWQDGTEIASPPRGASTPRRRSIRGAPTL